MIKRNTKMVQKYCKKCNKFLPPCTDFENLSKKMQTRQPLGIQA